MKIEVKRVPIDTGILGMLNQFVIHPNHDLDKALPLDGINVTQWFATPRLDLNRLDWVAVLSVGDDDPGTISARNVGLYPVNNYNLYPQLSVQQLRADAYSTFVGYDVSSSAVSGFADGMFASCPRQNLQITTTNAFSAVIIEGRLLCRWRSDGAIRVLYAGHSYGISSRLAPLVSPTVTREGRPTQSANEYSWVVVSDDNKWSRVFTGLLMKLYNVSQVLNIGKLVSGGGNNNVTTKAGAAALTKSHHDASITVAELQTVIDAHHQQWLRGITGQHLVLCLYSEDICADVVRSLTNSGVIVVVIKKKRSGDARKSAQTVVLDTNDRPRETEGLPRHGRCLVLSCDGLSVATTLRKILTGLPNLNSRRVPAIAPAVLPRLHWERRRGPQS